MRVPPHNTSVRHNGSGGSIGGSGGGDRQDTLTCNFDRETNAGARDHPHASKSVLSAFARSRSRPCLRVVNAIYGRIRTCVYEPVV